MPAVLICTHEPLDQQLGGTALWREDVERHAASSAEAAKKLLQSAKVHLLVVHRDLPGAAELLHVLRRQSDTRHLSMMVVAPEDFDPAEVELLEAGANAILRLPASAEWDERLTRLMEVPVRKDVRFPMSFEILTHPGGSVETVSALTVNLSVSGMLIASSFELRIGADLDFDFRLPDDDVTIRGCGRVVRMAARNRYGVEFYGLEGDGQERVQAFIEAQHSD
jgi:CheY-like chemotaxis protein